MDPLGLSVEGGDSDQPAKRREWWIDERLSANSFAWDKAYTDKPAWDAARFVRVIEAPSEAEIEAAVVAGMDYAFKGHNTSDSIRAAIRKLLGGE